MLIRLCGFAHRKPNKINGSPIAIGIRDSGARNEQDLERGETRPLICMLFFADFFPHDQNCNSFCLFTFNVS